MDVLTWSAAAPMGRQLLCALLGISETSMSSALSLGVSLRLIQRTQSNAYALHRLIREVRRDFSWIEHHSSWMKERCGRLSTWFESVKRNFADVARFESEVDHLRAWLDLARRFSPNNSARLTWLLAYPPYHRARYTESKELLEQASQINSGLPRPDELLQAHIWNDLSTINAALGDLHLAIDLAQRALEIRQRLLGEDNRDTAMSHNNVGAVFGHLENHEDSLKHCQRAHEIWLKMNGEYHIDTALALSNIAGAYRGQNEHDKALTIDLQALESRRKMFGENHPDTIGSMYACARDYLSLNSGIEEAERLATAGLASSRAVFGEKNPLTAGGLFQLADVFLVQGRFKEAADCSEKSLNLRTELFDYKHREIGLSAIQLSKILVRVGRVNQAFAMLDKLLSQIPRGSKNYEVIRDLHRHLSSTTPRPGFRQPRKRR